MTPDSSTLSFITPLDSPVSVHTADGTPCSITNQGILSTSRFSVPDVSFVPQLSMNLLSVGQLTDMNCFIGFDDSSCFIQDRQSRRVIGSGHRRRGSPSLYVLDTLHLPSTSTSKALVSSAMTILNETRRIIKSNETVHNSELTNRKKIHR